MRLPPLHRRPGVTLVELMVYVAVMAIVGSLVIPLLFVAAENRLLQQTISLVEHNAVQVLQQVSTRTRSAQRIVYPAIGNTGSYLIVTTASGGMNPTIIGTATGVLKIIEHLHEVDVSGTDVAIAKFVVRNTSASAARPSVKVTFDVIRTIRLQQPHTYARSYETAISLYPTDAPFVDPCHCGLAPFCTNGILYWEVCEEGVCVGPSRPLTCQ